MLSDELRRKLERAAAEELGRLVLSGLYNLVEAQETSRAPLPPINDESSVGALVEAARAVAEEHTALLRQLRAALVAVDRERALGLASQLCGLEECHEAGNRVTARIH